MGWAVCQVNICSVNHCANLIRNWNVPGSLLKLNSPPIKERATSFHHVEVPPGCPSPKQHQIQSCWTAGLLNTGGISRCKEVNCCLYFPPRLCKEFADALNKSPCKSEVTSMAGFPRSICQEKSGDTVTGMSPMARLLLGCVATYTNSHLHRLNLSLGPKCLISKASGFRVQIKKWTLWWE